MPISRRTAIAGGTLAGLTALGAAAVVGVETRVLPGRTTLNTWLGLTGGPTAVPDVTPSPTTSGSFASTHRGGASTNWILAHPAGVSLDGLPVLISLHGKGGDASYSFGASNLALEYYLTDSIERGNAPIAIASIDGGDTYWHARADGTDSGATVLDELVPLLADTGLDTSRIAFFGWSMGGYGAILLGQRSKVTPFAVAASSVAIWPSRAQAAAIAFDNDADYAANGLYNDASSLTPIPTRIACGQDDGFFGNNQSFAAALPQPHETEWAVGKHDVALWRRVMPGHLDYVSAHLGA